MIETKGSDTGVVNTATGDAGMNAEPFKLLKIPGGLRATTVALLTSTTP